MTRLRYVVLAGLVALLSLTVALRLGAQTPKQDSIRVKLATDSIIRISSSPRVDRLAKEVALIFNRIFGLIPAPVPPAPPPVTVVGVTITPKSDTTLVNTSISFAAIATYSNGTTGPWFPQWGASGGSITVSGSTTVYTAGSVAGAYVITATASGRVDSAAVLVLPNPPPPAGTLTLTLEGDPAVGAWAVRATPVGFTAARVTFSIDGTPFSTEGSAAYCLFGGDGPCTRSTLTPGSHVIRAAALSSLGTVLATASVTVVQGTAPPADSALEITRHFLYPKPLQFTTAETAVQCVFVVFRDGATAARAADRPECDPLYAVYAPAKRPTAGQQLVADAYCVTWTFDKPIPFVAKGCDTVRVSP